MVVRATVAYREGSPAMKHLVVLAAVVLSATPSSVLAAAADGRYAVKEAGAASCEQFLQAREQKDPAFFQFIGWVAGYVTGYNRFTPDTFDIAPWASIGLMDSALARLCSENRDKPFIAAVDFMITQIAPTKLSQPSDPVQAKSGDTTVVVYKEVLKRAQEKLAQKGLYKSAADGAFGDGTRKALEAYQKQANIPVTGLPDQQTLARLFSEGG